MIAELVAANAAFTAIKTAIQNGRQIADVASQVGKYVNATEDLRRKGEKKKRAGGADLEEFMHLEKLRQQEEELKQLMIYTGRPGLWHDWIKFQAQARKDRLAAAEARKRKIEQWIEIAIIVLVCVVGTVGLAALVAWAFYLKGI
jgi:hypothetical protein|tara:strand:- start:30 stop:464 length:435 start_codon:yes stop_codon:yes gene_type:complete